MCQALRAARVICQSVRFSSFLNYVLGVMSLAATVVLCSTLLRLAAVRRGFGGGAGCYGEPHNHWFAGYLRLFRFAFHRAAAPAAACSAMSGLPCGISGASTPSRLASAARITSLGVVPCFSQ